MVRTEFDGGLHPNLMIWTCIAIISSTKKHIRDKTTKLDQTRRVGLKVSTEKTKVMRINTGNQDKIVVNEIDIEDVDEFTYLGAKACNMEHLKHKARGAFIRLKNVWRSKRAFSLSGNKEIKSQISE